MTAVRTLAHIGLGGNVGDPVRTVTEAVAELSALPDTRLLQCSSLYRTAPVGFVDQAPFVNAVVTLETGLAPRTLLAALLDIERRHGRLRGMKNGPRTLDLDLLLYGGQTICEGDLLVPHPRLHERAFVLEPLLEIDPDCTIPGLGAARQFRAGTSHQGVERIPG